MDNKGVNKAALYAYSKVLAQEFEFARKLNSSARQASAVRVSGTESTRAWASILRFYANGKQKGGGKKNCRSVEYKQSGWKLSPDGMAITFTDGNQAGTFALYCNGEARRLLSGILTPGGVFI